MKYEIGDKVVIKTSDEDIFQLNNKEPFYVFPGQDLGKLEDFQPAQEKIKMTVEEKLEFDMLKEEFVTPYGAMSNMYEDNVPHLFKKVNTHESDEKRAENQFIFFKTFEHPELIEIVEPTYLLQILNNTDGFVNLVKEDDDDITEFTKGDIFIGSGDNSDDKFQTIFTQKEIDELSKSEQNKLGDLNKFKILVTKYCTLL